MRPEFQAFGVELSALELHAEGDKRTMVGYASAFDFPIPGMNGETVFIRSGAWNKTLKERREQIQVLFDHGYDNVIGDKPLGVPTVMRPDRKGLWTETPLSNTSYNRDIIIPLLEDGSLRAMSVGFIAQQESWNTDRTERYVEQGQLWDFGPTPFPRNLGATAALHSTRWRQDIEVHWDGAAALRSCDSASEFRQVAFERNNDSDPDTAAHWALPHHQSPGAPADPDGVRAALAAMSGARGGAPDLKDAGAAREHLQAHQASFDSNHPEAEASTFGDRATDQAGTSLPEADRLTAERLELAKADDIRLAAELRREEERIKRWAPQQS